MASRPRGATRRSVHVALRLRPDTALILDRMRQEQTKTQFIEDLIHAEDQRRNEQIVMGPTAK